MTRLLLTVVACLLWVPTVSAQSWKVGGAPVADTSWAKSDGDFGAQFVFTDKPDALFAAWGQPSRGVSISETSEAMRGAPVVGVVFFAGCGVDARGNCNATVLFSIEGPDGAAWGKPIEGELWVDKPRPHDGQLELGVESIGIVIEPHDRLGPYEVKAVIRDNITNRTMVLARTITAVEATQR